MKIKIDGKEYDFRMKGTVGLVYLAERMLGEPLKDGDKYHALVLYYCCLCASNRGKDVPDLMEFIGSLTIQTLNEMSTYFWDEWRRLEGEPQPKAEEDAQGEG